VKNNLIPNNLASPDWLSADTSLITWKYTNSSVDGEPAIVTAPLSADTSKSLEVPLCAFAVATTFVPNAVFWSPLSANATPDNPQAVVPVLVPVTVKNAWKVTVPSFHSLGNATVNCAFSSELGSKSKTFISGPLDNSTCVKSAQPEVLLGYIEEAGIHIDCLPTNPVDKVPAHAIVPPESIFNVEPDKTEKSFAVNWKSSAPAILISIWSSVFAWILVSASASRINSEPLQSNVARLSVSYANTVKISLAAAALARTTLVPFEAVKSVASNNTPFKNTSKLPDTYARVLPLASEPLNVVWLDVAVYLNSVLEAVVDFEIVTVPLVIAVVTPVPPANFNVSLPNVIVSDVDESSTIVKSEDTLAVEAAVIRPWASIVKTGIALLEPTEPALTAVLSRLIVTVSPDIADVVPVPPDIFNVSVASEIVAAVEASSTNVKSVEILAVEALVICPWAFIANTGIAVDEPTEPALTPVFDKFNVRVSPDITEAVPVPPDIFKLSVASVISTDDEESSTSVILVALYLVLKVSKVSVVATGVNDSILSL